MRMLVVWVMLALLPGLSAAATFVVTKYTDDDGPCATDDCALREAVLAANALPGPDLVVLPGGTYRLTIAGLTGENASLSGDLDIRDDLEIRGDPAVPTIIESTVGNERVIQAGAGSLTLVDLEVTGGQTPEGGSGIWAVVADLELRNCTVRGNQAGFDGGGLFVGLNQVRLINSTIANNTTALNGGGLSVRGSSVTPTSLLLENVTISGNVADSAGAIYAVDRSDRRLVNVTISGNEAFLVDGVLVDLITSQAMQWTNTLTDDDCGFIRSPAPISGGGNMESPGSTCSFPDPTDRMNVPDLLLGPLAMNGGPTQTHALLPGSPAIDGGGRRVPVAGSTRQRSSRRRGLRRRPRLRRRSLRARTVARHSYPRWSGPRGSCSPAGCCRCPVDQGTRHRVKKSLSRPSEDTSKWSGVVP